MELQQQATMVAINVKVSSPSINASESVGTKTVTENEPAGIITCVKFGFP